MSFKPEGRSSFRNRNRYSNSIFSSEFGKTGDPRSSNIYPRAPRRKYSDYNTSNTLYGSRFINNTDDFIERRKRIRGIQENFNSSPVGSAQRRLSSSSARKSSVQDDELNVINVPKRNSGSGSGSANSVTFSRTQRRYDTQTSEACETINRKYTEKQGHLQTKEVLEERKSSAPIIHGETKECDGTKSLKCKKSPPKVNITTEPKEKPTGTTTNDFLETSTRSLNIGRKQISLPVSIKTDINNNVITCATGKHILCAKGQSSLSQKLKSEIDSCIESAKKRFTSVQQKPISNSYGKSLVISKKDEEGNVKEINVDQMEVKDCEERFDESQFSAREKQWMAERDTLRHSMAASSSSPNLTKENACDTFDGAAAGQNGEAVLSIEKTEADAKNGLKLTLDLSTKTGEEADMQSSRRHIQRSTSLSDAKLKGMSQRRKPSAQARSFDLNESLPDLPDTPKAPNNSLERLKHDYGITELEIIALRGILRKTDLYDQNVRDRMFQVLKVQEKSEEDLEIVTSKLMKEREIESMKQKLFMSRKELDSYISFTKKMEREKRQSMSEKEELETKIQWHERRLTRFENDNKSLKKERADLLNQIYELRGKSASLGKEPSHTRQKSLDTAINVVQQPELEISKQRLIYEADAFAQERAKLIKERQRLDEEVRKVQIRCVSLLAQLQHSEKTVEELKTEKESVKIKMTKALKQANDEIESLRDRLTNAENTLNQFNANNNEYISKPFVKVKHGETKAFHDDTRLKQLENEYDELEIKFDNLQNEFRNTEELKISLEHENMALKDTVNVVQKAKEDSDRKLSETETKYRDTLGELKAVTVISEKYQQERFALQEELENVSSRLSQLQHEIVNIEADQDAFKKFLDKLSMELQEKLGEEHVSNDKEADSLEKQAEIIGREIVAHLNPSRKLQDDYESLKQDRDDLEEEIRYLKFALSTRMEIKTMQLPTPQKCECSKEKEQMQKEYDEAIKRIEALEDEVTRLHQDKQQLLMSFLNLQASQRSREVSRTDVRRTTDEDATDADEDEYTDGEETTERESVTSGSNVGSTIDIKVRLDSDSPLAKAKVTSQRKMSEYTPDEECDRLELLNRLREVTKTKERLESERVEMLDSLCKQVECNDALKLELEELKHNSRNNSRPGSAISKSESYSSLNSEKCANCANSGEEIRSYLSIIEELTEDKLRLEKTVTDIETDKENLKVEVERITEQMGKIESDLALVGNDREYSIKQAKEETQFLLQNIEALETENSDLEENLRKLREDKAEILDNLRQAEEDRLGFIRSIQLITESKETVENEATKLRAENKELRNRLKKLDEIATLQTSNLSEDEPTKEKDVTELPPLTLERTFSVPASNRKLTSSSPREYPMRRVDSVENILELDELSDKNELENQLSNLKEQVSSYRTMTSELNESLDVATSLLQKEKMINRRLSAELETRHSVNPSLKRSPSDISQKQLQRSESIVNCAPRHKLYNQRQLSYGEMMELINKTTVPQEDEQQKHLAKTLSFQVSFNGVPVHTKNDF